MNIGILTFHFPLNYGAMLQAYALRSKIQNDGHSCHIIDYMPDYMSGTCNINPLFTNLPWKNKLKSFVKVPLRYLSYLKFVKFSEQYLSIDMRKSKKNKFVLSHDISAAIVGSDQVWNGNITNDDPAYFFCSLNTSLTWHSYAASIGGNVPTETVNSHFAEYLPKFASISVRETSLKDLLESEMGLKVSHVLDPVFLHGAKSWSQIAKKPRRVPPKFILYYSLEENQQLADDCRSIAQCTGWPIVSIHPFARRFIKESRQIYAAGPLEFLWLIQHAEYICTNSFHAVAFSSIFKKKLMHQSHSSLGARVESLLNLCSLKHEIVAHCNNDKVLQVIDFKQSDCIKMEEMILGSHSFIRQIYNNNVQ